MGRHLINHSLIIRIVDDSFIITTNILYAGFKAAVKRQKVMQRSKREDRESEIRMKEVEGAGSRCLPVGATGSQPLGTSIRMRKRALGAHVTG